MLASCSGDSFGPNIPQPAISTTSVTIANRLFALLGMYIPFGNYLIAG
jgi:hypothetical protein